MKSEKEKELIAQIVLAKEKLHDAKQNGATPREIKSLRAVFNNLVRKHLNNY